MFRKFVSESNLLTIVESIFSQTLDNNNPKLIDFFLECFTPVVDDYIVPPNLIVDGSINKSDLLLIASLAMANNNEEMATYILEEMKKFYKENLPKKSNNSPVIVSVFVIPYELSTILSEENSTEFFIKNILQHLPIGSKIQIINCDCVNNLKSTSYIDDSYISTKLIEYTQYNIVTENEIVFNINLFESISNSDIVFAIPNAIELLSFVKPICVSSSVMINCTSFNPFFKLILNNIHKLKNYELISSVKLNKLNYSALMTLTMFANIQENFIFSKDLQHLLLAKMPDSFLETKSLVFLTDAPSGTLGDISAASKAITCFKMNSKYADYEFVWIIREPNGQIKAQDLIPDNVKVIYVSTWTDIRYNPNIILLLLKQPLLISYPTFHYLIDSDKQFLTNYGSSLFDITEYDYLTEEKEKPTLLQREHFMETGLSKRSIGIFVKPKKLFNSQDDFYDNWLNTHLSNDQMLFFGYLNKELAQVQNGVTATLFAVMCIKKALQKMNKQHCIINIVCIFTPEDFENIKQEIMELPISSLSFLSKKTNRVFEFNSTLTQEKMINSIEVRLLNPFPLVHHDMELLLMKSDPFVALTGDSSLIEGIECHKVILYQIMEWKINWFNSCIKYADDLLSTKYNPFYTLEFKFYDTFKIYIDDDEYSYDPSKLFLIKIQETGEWRYSGYNKFEQSRTGGALCKENKYDQPILSILESNKTLNIDEQNKIIIFIKNNLRLSSSELSGFWDLQFKLSENSSIKQKLLTMICKREDELIADVKQLHQHVLEHSNLYKNLVASITDKSYLSGILKVPVYKQLSINYLQNLHKVALSVNLDEGEKEELTRFVSRNSHNKLLRLT